jgi:2,4-diaminopentanoate dehydrogenase
MQNKTYRVIQWATGHVGKVAIRHFAENPTYDLAGVLVTNPRKVGRDAGEIAGIGPIGVAATDDVEAIVAMDADCVHFAPSVHDLDVVCRLLRSGKNVVCPVGPFFPWERWKPDFDKLEAACRDGGTSFHGSGIHPGFAGDLLPLTLARVMSRIDHIHLYETIDHLANPSNYIEFMGFGREPADLLANPGRSPEAPYMFAQSMEIVARGLGLTIGDVTAKFAVAAATRDIAWPRGVVKQGTVAGQHYEWTGWAGGKPLITYHCFWTMGPDNIAEDWDCGESGYRIRIEGDPPMELTMARPSRPDEATPYLGLPWTAMAGVNVIPAVCDAAPGIVTHFELGLPQLRGLFRPG